MKKNLPLIFFCCLSAGWLLFVFAVGEGCATTPAGSTVQAEKPIIQAVNDAMTEFAAYANAGKATPAQITSVTKAYNIYFAAQGVAKAVLEKSIAGGGTQADIDTANAAVITSEQALISLVNSFIK